MNTLELSQARCPVCLTPLDLSASDTASCRNCGSRFAHGLYPGTISTTRMPSNFSHQIDAIVLDEIIPWLEHEGHNADIEVALDRFGAVNGLSVGNPFWEGRADFVRLQPGARGVVLDVGCGMGTIATALARTAEHVFALDRSPIRVALTAARARAAGCTNLTGVHGLGLELPFGDGIIDLVTIVGVLEWVGVGERDPLAAQVKLLSEACRVLKPTGTLVIGIENRYGAHYFAGAREEHVGLPFVSLLPRALARAYCRATTRPPFETPTHSERALRTLLRSEGFETRFAYPLPSYSEPQFAFDEGDVKSGRDFYLRHFFHFTSRSRRLAGRMLAVAPTWLVRAVAPSFWVVASRARAPRQAPAVAIGKPTIDGTVKVFDFARATVSRYDRRSLRFSERVALVDGWNARRWINWPLSSRSRRRRAEHVLRQLTGEFASVDRGPWEDSVGEEALGEAARGLEAIEHDLPQHTLAWCHRAIERVRVLEPEVGLEHGDFRLVNLIVCPDGRLVAVDQPSAPRRSIVGRDAVSAVLDVFGLSNGTKAFCPAAGLAGLRAAPASTRTAGVAALRAGAGYCAVQDLTAVVCVALLRDCGDKRVPLGITVALSELADGELDEAFGNGSLSPAAVPSLNGPSWIRTRDRRIMSSHPLCFVAADWPSQELSGALEHAGIP
jgi:SAM-dependent methyltransferase